MEDPMANIDDEFDLVLQLLKRHSIPITRENYIAWAFGSGPPDPWTWEHEWDLPKDLQTPFDGENPPPPPSKS
jgi:hypothetical protein